METLQDIKVIATPLPHGGYEYRSTTDGTTGVTRTSKNYYAFAYVIPHFDCPFTLSNRASDPKGRKLVVVEHH